MSTVRIQLRRGTASDWTSVNPILAAGEAGFETDTLKIKLGNGSDYWNDLGYATVTPDELTSAIQGASDTLYIAFAEKGVANGVATLDSDGKVPDTQIPSGITRDSELSSAISTEVTNRNSAIATAKSEAISTAEGYTDTAVAGLVNSSPDLLNTLKELADAIGDDANFSTTVASNIATGVQTAKTYSDTVASTQATNALNSAKQYADDKDNALHTTIDSQIDTAKSQAITTSEAYTDGLVSTEAINRNNAINNEVTNRNNAIATAKSEAISTSETYADTAISTEVTNRNSAINTAKSQAISTAEGYTDTTISTEVTNRNNAIATAKSEAISTSETYADTVSSTTLSSARSYADTKKSEAITASESYTDTAISTEVTNRNSAINTAKSQAISTAEGYTDTAIANLINGAPSTLDTLSEIATALGSDANLATTLTNSIALKAPIASPTFTGTVSGITKSMVGLGSVDNTSDSAKPVSTAQQTALDAKAPLASPTFTGTVAGITKSMVGLGNVDNTSDANKPVSSAAQTALDAKLSLSGGTMTGALTLSGAPTQDSHAATKAYVDGIASGINFHAAARVATTGNLSTNYSNGTNGYGATLTADTNRAFSTVDGVSGFSVGDRILVRAQTDAKQNGIYVVTTIGSTSAPWVLTRSADADNNPNGEVSGGDFIFVTAGTLSANTGYILSGTGTLSIGTDNINYVQFNAAQAILAGTGLSKSGGTLSIDTATTVDLSTTQTMSNKTFVAPVLGSATATSINGTTIPSSKTLVTTADTGTVTSTMILDGTIVDADINASAAIATSKISGLDTALAAKLASATAATTYETIENVALKAPLASPTFTGTVNAAAVSTTGNVIVGGNLTVNGTTTTINSTTVSTTDSNIEIAKVETPTDVTANGAGITVKGATDKTINWYSSTGSFTISENVDLASGKTYKINGTDVLTSTAVLGKTPGGTSNGDIVTIDGTQTLTNKTLTSPTVSNPTWSGTATLGSGGKIQFADGTQQSTAAVPSLTTLNTQTGAYTPSAASERDSMIVMNNTSDATITIPNDSNVLFATGASLDILQKNTGVVTIAGDTGVTVNSSSGFKTRAQWSTATIMKIGSNEWVVYGDLKI